MDENEFEIIKSIWNVLKHHEAEILYEIFKTYPDIQEKFSAFAGKDLETIKESPDFALQANKIVTFFKDYVKLLKSEASDDEIDGMLNELAHSHRNRGVTKDNFINFRTAMTQYVKNHTTYNDDVEFIINKLFDHMYDCVFKALN